MEYNRDRTLMKPSDFDWQNMGGQPIRIKKQKKGNQKKKTNLTLLIIRLHNDWLPFFLFFFLSLHDEGLIDNINQTGHRYVISYSID
jgi:hypothetical protein